MAGECWLLLPQICLQEKSDPFCKGALGGSQAVLLSHPIIHWHHCTTLPNPNPSTEDILQEVFTPFSAKMYEKTKQMQFKRSSLIPGWYLKYFQSKVFQNRVNIYNFPRNNQSGIKLVPCYSCQHSPLVCTATGRASHCSSCRPREGGTKRGSTEGREGMHWNRMNMNMNRGWALAVPHPQRWAPAGHSDEEPRLWCWDDAAISILGYRQALVPSPLFYGARGNL